MDRDQFLPSVMAVRLELVEGRKQKSEDFEAEYARVCDHLYFQCLDDRGDPQGYAVAEAVKKFRSDGDGAFFPATEVRAGQ